MKKYQNNGEKIFVRQREEKLVEFRWSSQKYTCKFANFSYQECTVRHQYKQHRFKQWKITDSCEFGHQSSSTAHQSANHQRQCEYEAKVANGTEKCICLKTTRTRVMFVIFLYWAKIATKKKHSHDLDRVFGIHQRIIAR